MNPKSKITNRIPLAQITPALWNNYVADLGAGWSISEVYGSDDLAEGIPTKRYLSEGNSNVWDVYNAARALAPWGFLGENLHFYYAKKPDVEAVPNTSDVFDVTIKYTEQNKDDTDPDEPWSRTVSVSVNLENEHRQVSRGTASSGTATTGNQGPDFGGTVGVTPQAIGGYDLGVPRISIVFDIEAADLTDAQLKSLYDEVGTINNAAIFGRDIGEVLYSEFSYTKTAFHKTKLRFGFKVRKNEQNIQPPNGLVPIANKEGWQFLWFYMIEETDNQTKTTVTKPVAWYLENVYEKSAWTNTKAITGTTLALQDIGGPTPPVSNNQNNNQNNQQAANNA